MKKWIAIGILAMMTLGLVGCGKENTADPVVATVNGVEIYQSQQQEEVELLSKMYQVELDESSKSYLEDYALQQLINDELILQKGENSGVSCSEEELDAYIADQFGDVEEFSKSYLEPSGVSLDAFKKSAKVAFVYNALSQQVLDGLDIDAKAIYDEAPENYIQEATATASHILVETEEEAKDIIAQLDGGADFAQLAKERSIDTASGANGGELGTFVYSDMVEEFSAAAFAMPIGTYSKEPVISGFGYHIIYLTDKTEAAQMSFEEAREQIITNAENQALEAFFDGLQDDAEISYAGETAAK